MEYEQHQKGAVNTAFEVVLVEVERERQRVMARYRNCPQSLMQEKQAALTALADVVKRVEKLVK